MSARRRVIAAAVAMSVMAVAFAAPATGASTAFTVSGTRTFHAPPYPEQLLPGLFAGDTVEHISYPAAVFGMDASIAVAVDGLSAGISSTAGPLVIAGYSQGAVAVAYQKQRIMAAPADQRPSADRLTFITMGDPTGPGGIMRFLPFSVPLIGISPISPPDTPYTSIIVNGEYDGWGDFPDRPWNLISVANALLGIAYVHGHYEVVPGGFDLSTVPATNITVTTNSLGGVTTSYLIPTATLPLLQPLLDIGVPAPVVTALEAPLRPIVDAGYIRNDAKPAAVQPVLPSATAAPKRGVTAAAVPRPQRVTPAAAGSRPTSPTGPRRAAAVVRPSAAA